MMSEKFDKHNEKKTNSRDLSFSLEKDREYLLEEFTDAEMVDQCLFLLVKIYESSDGVIIQKRNINGRLYIAYKAEDLHGNLQTLYSGLSFSDKLDIVINIFNILERIHSNGIIYNNLNLESCYLYNSRSVLLAGFHNFVSKYSPVSVAGPDDFVVNPNYMSPELTGKTKIPLSVQSDYYAMGILMYKMFTGKYPFYSEDLSNLYAMQIAKRPEPPASIDEGIPVNLSHIIMKLLEKDPAQRYRSHNGILFDLEHFYDTNFRLAAEDYDTEFHVSQKIYGRENEISLLRNSIRKVEEGNLQTVVIAGYSGVGKSSLVEEISRFESSVNLNFLSGKFQQYKSNIPYFALVEALNAFFDKLLLSRNKELERFRKKFNSKIGEQGAVLTSVFPALELIVGEQLPVNNLAGIEAENRFLLTFIDFIRIIATKQAPLILFLDDLQWTDLISLKILRAIIKEQIKYVFIGLAYRDNEVDIHHPLFRFLDEIKKIDNETEIIKLQDLKIKDISRLLVDSRVENPAELALIIQKKTGGNSFFVHQYIRSIVLNNLLDFIPEKNLWRADIRMVSELEVSDNVVKFMQQLLESYNPEITRVLEVAGMLGHSVEYKILEVVLGKGKVGIKQLLAPVFADNLLIETGTSIRFAHDRIQQACYQLNSEDELPEIHYNIACLLIENNICRNIDELFSVISHLDKGFEYVLKQARRFFELYLAAAIKSREIAAYREFLEFIQKTTQLLYPGISQKLRYECYSEYHVALHLNGKYEEADDFFENKLLDYSDFFALKNNYVTKVSQDSMLGKYREATVFGLSILEKLNIHINMSPDISELSDMLKRLRKKARKSGFLKFTDVKKIPVKKPKEMNFICELISAVLPGSFFYSPLVSGLLILETIELAMRNGIYPSMGYSFSLSTAMFVLVENNYTRGFDYAEFAMEISAHDKRSLGNSKHILILTCWHWVRPIKDNTSLEIAREAFHLLLKGGDIQMSGFIFANTTGYLFERGEPLDEVLEELNIGLDYVRKTSNFHAIGGFLVWEQFLLSMMSEDALPDDFRMNGFTEKQFFIDYKLNFMAQANYFSYKTQYLYMNKQYESAFEYALKAKEKIVAVTAFISVATHYFYGALCFCRKFKDNSELEVELDDYISQLEQWSEHVPENWLQRYYLVLAEKYRFSGDKVNAGTFYARAISTARNNGFTQDLALSYELFSDFWYEQNNLEFGNSLLEMAYKSYKKWGAVLKLRSIENENPELAGQFRKKNIDLFNIIKAQNILAQETRIDVLLKKMLQILIEFSGAEKCYLIRFDREWHIAAFLDIQGKENILNRIELRPDLLSVDLVNYVIRTKKAVTPEELKTRITDTYFLGRQPKSTFVLPVINQSELISIIYLEHGSIKNVFTEDKRETIQLLSSQMAISLVNAGLYENLEKRVKQRTKEIEIANNELSVKNIQLDKALKDLTKSDAELRASNSTKDKFFSIIAHDLKSPIGGVANILDLLETGRMEFSDNVLSTMNRTIQNIYKLLEDLLLWARSQQKSLVASPTNVKVKDLVETAVGVYQMAAEKKSIKIKSDSTDENLSVYTDLSMTDTVLRNLINNAIKFTPVSGSVTIKSGSIDGAVRISINDTGVGMDKEVSDNLFRIDSKSKIRHGTEDESGTGLGLIVCRELIKLCNGRMGFESTPGKGSNFWIELPPGK